MPACHRAHRTAQKARNCALGEVGAPCIEHKAVQSQFGKAGVQCCGCTDNDPSSVQIRQRRAYHGFVLCLEDSQQSEQDCRCPPSAVACLSHHMRRHECHTMRPYQTTARKKAAGGFQCTNVAVGTLLAVLSDIKSSLEAIPLRLQHEKPKMPQLP